MARKRAKSRRGGGSASQACRKGLSFCMNESVKMPGGSLKKAAPYCMSEFNECRSGGKKRTVRKAARKAKPARRRRAKR